MNIKARWAIAYQQFKKPIKKKKLNLKIKI